MESSGKAFFLAFIVIILGVCCSEGPSPVKTPEEEVSTFLLEEGLKIELVAAEPLVEDPVVITFDEAGRLWVVEMRGFMPNIDMEGEEDPVGRISILLDNDKDGQMDESIIFLDSLVLPRSIAFVPGGVLVAENKPLWFVQDLDGDLIADKKTLLDSTYGGRAMPEHSPNGLWRNMDNWYYNAKSTLRYQFTIDQQLVVDPTEFRGQWGISHDNTGRLFYNYNWSQLHADLVPPNYFNRNQNHVASSGIDHGLTIDRRVYPIRPNPAVNRGYIPGTLDEEGKLLEFTSACAPLVYRGDALGSAYLGNAFVCEPAGNLIKRNIVEDDGLMVSAFDPHPGREFLASTDERFRPVYLANGPEGALYIADMYRGINQHGLYMTEYLREQTLKRKLDQPINKGRIWRIVPKDWSYTPPTDLSSASIRSLVVTLSDANGFLRDVAQRLLIELDNPAAIPDIEELVRDGRSALGRLHALWTLEGMGAVSQEVLFVALQDDQSIVKNAALRILEPLAESNDKIAEKLIRYIQDNWMASSPETALQMALTLGNFTHEKNLSILNQIANKYPYLPVMRDAILSSIKNCEFQLLQKIKNEAAWVQADINKEIFVEMLGAAIARKKDPDEITKLLNDLQKSEARYSWLDKAALNGIAIQAPKLKSAPIHFDKQPVVFDMMANTSPNLQRNLNAFSQMLSWPGHEPEEVESSTANLSEEEQEAFALGRTHYLTSCAACHGTNGEGLNRFAPPLVNSEWVLGDEKKLALILLHGLEGPIVVNDVKYDAPEILPVMPSHSTLADNDIAAILTYIRNEWGHSVGAVSRGTVGMTRVTSQGRVIPWTAEELHKLNPEEKSIQ